MREGEDEGLYSWRPSNYSNFWGRSGMWMMITMIMMMMVMMITMFMVMMIMMLTIIKYTNYDDDEVMDIIMMFIKNPN